MPRASTELRKAAGATNELQNPTPLYNRYQSHQRVRPRRDALCGTAFKVHSSPCGRRSADDSDRGGRLTVGANWIFVCRTRSKSHGIVAPTFPAERRQCKP